MKMCSVYLHVAVGTLALLFLCGCDVERRKSDAELGLNPQQSAGRQLYDNYCDRCHEPYSSRGKKGPGLKGVFKQQYLPLEHTLQPRPLFPACRVRFVTAITIVIVKLPACRLLRIQSKLSIRFSPLHIAAAQSQQH